MPKTRSWQDSFDRLEAVRREERFVLNAQSKPLGKAKTVNARAAAQKAESPAPAGLMLVSEVPDTAAPPAKARQRAKPPAKPAKAKTAPRKRSAVPKAAAPAKPKEAKSPAAKPRKAAAARAPILADALPAVPPELLLITPLPRSASLLPYRKPGLFGLIGSWLRIASRRTLSGLTIGGLPPNVRAKPRTPGDELAELRAENQRLQRQLEALLALQDIKAKAH